MYDVIIQPLFIIFSNSKEEEDVNKFGKRSHLWNQQDPQNNRVIETPKKFQTSSPSVASMCKHFENAKISAS